MSTPAPPPGRVTLAGDLAGFFPAEVLQLLQLAQATGWLELERRGERTTLAIEGGRPVFARTDATSVRLGELLLHHGAISRENLELALTMQSDDPGERLGAMLIASGLVDRAQVETAVREVVKRIVYGVLLWREGTFRFLPGPVGSEDVKLELELDRLILEGLRQADEERR
ncbi:MAG TPA: DUF4388 domain-containing protein [Dongiaceae bacterium]|nr:DUF4388 domain-containing protein [Dongiaceae bacterium]